MTSFPSSSQSDEQDEMLDEALRGSFPASDPISSLRVAEAIQRNPREPVKQAGPGGSALRSPGQPSPTESDRR